MVSAYILTISGVILIATRNRNSLERARRAELLKSNQELQAVRDELEQRVSARTTDIEHRTRFLETIADIARQASLTIDQNELLDNFVRLIGLRLSFYNVGLYLMEDTGEWAKLRAASSIGGQQMLARDHRVNVGDEGVVGYAINWGRPRISLDIGTDLVFVSNPDLPETRSEIALPLLSRNQIIGALEIQSKDSHAFNDEEDVNALQTVADQVAIAISNAHLFQQAQDALESERRAYGEYGQRAWQELIKSETELAFYSDGQDPVPAGDIWRPEMHAALQTGQITSDENGMNVAIPIKVRDQVIGVIDGSKPGDSGKWGQDDLDLLSNLTDQLSVALESARLYQETQLQAAQEQLTRFVTEEMQQATEIDELVQSAMQELYSALDAARVVMHLGTEHDLQEKLSAQNAQSE
jgi:GAF domain-containing protein